MNNSIQDNRRIRNDRIISLLVGLAALLVYIITLAPTVSFWDSGEYLTCSWIVGVPHPPGVPLFVLLGRFSTLLFSFIPAIAPRVNLLCAFSGAITIGLLVRLVQRWGHRMDFTHQWYRPMSVLAGFIAAFSYSIWRNSNATETYAPALLLTFIILWAFDCWIEKYAESGTSMGKKDSGGWGEARYLLLISYLIILAIANHGSVPFIAGPPMLLIYLIYAFRRRTRIWRKSWFILTMLGLVVLAFSVHLYMPLRAVQQPEINESNASKWENFEHAFTREQYGNTSILERKGPFIDQMKLYLEYLSWQSGRVDNGWDRLLGDTMGGAASMLVKIVLVFGAIYGLVVLGMKRPKLLLYLGMLFLMSSILFIFFILNFKTGPEGTEIGEVRERDYFFGASFAFFAILSGIGLISVLKDFLSEKSRIAWLVLIIPAASLAVNFYRCDRSQSYFAHDYGINLLESCPENAVLITNGDNDTFPLWFAQGVLGVRRDVIISNLSLMNTTWYVDQLIDRDPLLLSYRDLGLVDSLRPIFIWGPHHFHIGENGAPETSSLDGEILRATFSQSWPWAVIDDGMALAMPTEGTSNQGALTMQDLVLINMIQRRSLHGREIYFAGTVSRDSRQFLEFYQEMEGIAFRITDVPVFDAVNSSRGWELMDSYRFTGVDDPDIFKCDQAIQLLRNYVSAYHQLTYQYLSIGEPDSAMLALDGAADLFISLPSEWIEILPSRAYIIAKLTDGLYGAAAARDTLLSISEDLLQTAQEMGNLELANMARYLAGLATGLDGSLGYQQEIEYEQLFDYFDDGSLAFDWIRVELALMFTDYVGAWSILDSAFVPDDSLSIRLHQVAVSTLNDYAETIPFNSRINPYDSGISVILEYIDTSSPTEFRLRSDTGPDDILGKMYTLVSRGRIMSAMAAGFVLSDYLEDQNGAELVRDYAEVLAFKDQGESREWALWFLTEGNRVSGKELAWMAAKSGHPSMMYSALEESGDIGSNAMNAIFDDPYAYAASVPDPGTGSGVYSWVNSMEVTPDD